MYRRGTMPFWGNVALRIFSVQKGCAMEKISIDREKLIVNMAENLPALRAQLDLTQEEVAGIIGVSRSTVHAIENRKRDMTCCCSPKMKKPINC